MTLGLVILLTAAIFFTFHHAIEAIEAGAAGRGWDFLKAAAGFAACLVVSIWCVSVLVGQIP